MVGRISEAAKGRRGAAVLLLSGLLLVLSSILGIGATAAPKGNGANQDCGAYCPSGVGLPSGNGNGNGNATGKPCAGCVGNADSKNPPGQFKDGSDHNAGYECDRNHGIGRTNPAHSGCHAVSTTSTTAPECVDSKGNKHKNTDECCPDDKNSVISGNAGDEAKIGKDNGKGNGNKNDACEVTTTTVPKTTTTTVPQTTTSTVPKTTTTTVPQTTTSTVPQTTTSTVPQTTTSTVPQTTTSTVPETTTTTVPQTTTTTAVPDVTTTTAAQETTTTTVATNVLGERFVQPSNQVASSTASQPLARTGSNVRTELFWAGLALALGGLAAMFGELRGKAQEN